MAVLGVDGNRAKNMMYVLPLVPRIADTSTSVPLSSESEDQRRVLTQYRERTGSLGTVSRSHIETLPDGSEVKLGVFLSNTKTRRAKLSNEQLERLAGLGLDWAAQAVDAV
ncbi:helicase [Streptomyces sp. NPDC052101]|uniref:helicase n=1 Tax=Streptomyces sp. NPDC052101 TaxID=3155763 RepID=UPI003447FE2B